MHDDPDPETMADGASEDAGDPAQAFEGLRRTVENLAGDLTREMTTIRKGVEAAIEAFETQEAPPNYGADLGRLAQQLAGVAQRLDAVEQSPLLQQTAQHYAAIIEGSGKGLVRTAVQSLERQAAAFEHAGQELAGRVASARERTRQNEWLFSVGMVSLVVGASLMLIMPAVLPFSAAPRVASIVMGKTPWQAGMDLMAFGSPEAWQRVASADLLIEANKETVAACREAAAKAKKEQRCTITVAAPAQ